MSQERSKLLETISARISDYRLGEIEPRSPAVVNAWIKQFNADLQLPILTELDHVLSKTYVNQKNIRAWLTIVATDKRFGGDDPKAFWQKANILRIQTGGTSQSDLLTQFEEVLRKEHQLKLSECGSKDGVLVYLDDILCGGTRMHNDFRGAFLHQAPKHCRVFVIHFARHEGGKWHAGDAIKRDWSKVGKRIELTWSKCVRFENRLSSKDKSDVLWPSHMPQNDLAKRYEARLSANGYPLQFRSVGQQSLRGIFTGEPGRELLEQQFLAKGLEILSNSPNLPASTRPLGWMKLDTLGPGMLVVTYRNCANSCPLVYWNDGNWTPLFPRKTNAPSAASFGFKDETRH